MTLSSLMVNSECSLLLPAETMTEEVSVDDIKTEFGGRLRGLRKRQGWSQELLGEKAGVDPKFVSRLEGGKANPSLVTLAKLATAFQLKPADLLDFDDELEPKKARARVRAQLQALVKNRTDEELARASRVLKSLLT